MTGQTSLSQGTATETRILYTDKNRKTENKKIKQKRRKGEGEIIIVETAGFKLYWAAK
jgi:hypothetical protein